MKLIMFDMDGTLIDSGELIANTINHVRYHYDLAPMDKGLLLENINNPHINPAKFFYDTEKFTKYQTELFSDYYTKHCDTDMVVYDGIIELLDKLKSKYRLSVATNASTKHATTMLSNTKLKEYFELIVGADIVANPKPKPDMLLYTLDKLEVHKSSACLVGDSPKDKIAAQSAGIKDYIVNWGFTLHDSDVIKSTEELEKLFLYLI